MSESPPLRNIAIVAHVDHGKTTLVDQLLRQSGAFRSNQIVEERVMDSNPLERERGITILAKNTSIRYMGVKINIIDTPGHADFGGEVERVLKMADSVLLLVDAFEGTKPQTKFVLRKALGYGLRPIVVINKIDIPEARPVEVLNGVFDLFCELGANDEQLDFAHCFASAREGFAKREMADASTDMIPLFDMILEKVPPPQGDPTAPLQVLVSNIDYNDYVGRIGIGRVFNGSIAVGQPITLLRKNGGSESHKVVSLFTFENIKRTPVESAAAGEIVAIAGIPDVDINDTIAAGDSPTAIPPVSIDEPTMSMIFGVNDSPLSGRSGKFLTSRHLRDRLLRELRSNVALRVRELEVPDQVEVSGRGLLHLSVLIETMRREGFELQVSRPHVILHEKDGLTLEPIEDVSVDVPGACSGRVIEMLGSRRGEMTHMVNTEGQVHFEFTAPSRGLIGLRSRLLTATRGEAVLYHTFSEFGPYRGDLPGRGAGVLVSMSAGPVTSYALNQLQDRGEFFVAPGDEVYEGMVVGEHCKTIDISVNACKKRHLTNMRAASADNTIVLAPPRVFSLEEALEYIEDDELVEVTPAVLRLRKKVRSALERKRMEKAEEALEGGD